MKSFAVVLIVSMSLCGFFPQTATGLSCYQCKWTDAKCATESDDDKLLKVECKPNRSIFLQKLADEETAPAGDGAPAEPAAPGAPAEPAAPGAPGAPAVPSDTKFYCFKMNIKENVHGTAPAVERGCKTTKEITDCKFDKTAHPEAIQNGDCVVCDKDNCNGNGQSMVTGSAVHCALIAAMVVARMIFQTK